MILGFTKKFPDGNPTQFKEQILQGIKIHSMREGDRWAAGMDIHMAYGVRTKHYEQFNKERPDLQKCISTQDIFMTYNRHMLEVSIDDVYFYDRHILITNDGLVYERFIDWFFPNGKYEWSGQIIHWTEFKY